MTEPATTSDPEDARRIAWFQQVRALHKWKRAAGVIGCILAVILMLWSKYSPATAPPWATLAGLVIAGLSWALFAFVILARMMWVRRHPLNPKT